MFGENRLIRKLLEKSDECHTNNQGLSSRRNEGPRTLFDAAS